MLASLDGYIVAIVDIDNNARGIYFKNIRVKINRRHKYDIRQMSSEEMRLYPVDRHFRRRKNVRWSSQSRKI